MPADDRLPPGAGERDESAVAWVYGTILAAAAVAVATDLKASGSGEVLLYTAATMTVIWLAHAYAAFVGHGGRVDVPGRGARLRHGLVTELPVLASATPTLVALAISWWAGAGVGATGTVGLTVAITTMVLVAAGAARRSGAGRVGIAEAAASALLLGGIVVALKIALG